MIYTTGTQLDKRGLKLSLHNITAGHRYFNRMTYFGQDTVLKVCGTILECSVAHGIVPTLSNFKTSEVTNKRITADQGSNSVTCWAGAH